MGSQSDSEDFFMRSTVTGDLIGLREVARKIIQDPGGRVKALRDVELRPAGRGARQKRRLDNMNLFHF
jgi:hypothetical protein